MTITVILEHFQSPEKDTPCPLAVPPHSGGTAGISSVLILDHVTVGSQPRTLPVTVCAEQYSCPRSLCSKRRKHQEGGNIWIPTYGSSMLMYWRNQHNILIVLQLKIYFKKMETINQRIKQIMKSVNHNHRNLVFITYPTYSYWEPTMWQGQRGGGKEINKPWPSWTWLSSQENRQQR